MVDEDRTSKFARLVVVQSLFEGQQVEILLKEADIPAAFISYSDTALDGMYQMQKGYGEIRVPEEQRTKAQEILVAEMPNLKETFDADLELQALGARMQEEKPAPPGAFKFLIWFLVVAAAAVLFLVIRKAVSPKQSENQPPIATQPVGPKPINFQF